MVQFWISQKHWNTGNSILNQMPRYMKQVKSIFPQCALFHQNKKITDNITSQNFRKVIKYNFFNDIKQWRLHKFSSLFYTNISQHYNETWNKEIVRYLLQNAEIKHFYAAPFIEIIIFLDKFLKPSIIFLLLLQFVSNYLFIFLYK